MGEPVLIRIGGVNHRFARQQVTAGNQRGVVFAAGKRPGRAAAVQMLCQRGKDFRLMGEFFVALRGFRRLLRPPLHHFQIGHPQFQIDNANVPLRIGGPLHMDHVFVVETADHMDNGVRLPDIGQKLIAQPFALAGPFHQSRDVHKLHHRRGLLLRLVHLRQHVQPLVRHGHHAHVGGNGTEGIVRALRPGVGNGVKEGGLSHVGQSHDA